jgi:xanthine/uracil/vitamin C permease (AzgA family)
MDRIFRLQQNHTTVGREIIAGLTTFAAMAYILVVNPSILKAAGMPQAALVIVGVGLFIAFIGLKNGGLVIGSPATFVTMSDLATLSVTLFGAGLLITCILVARGIPASIIVSMGAITVLGLFVPDSKGGMVTNLPTSIVFLLHFLGKALVPH